MKIVVITMALGLASAATAANAPPANCGGGGGKVAGLHRGLGLHHGFGGGHHGMGGGGGGGGCRAALAQPVHAVRNMHHH